MPTPKRLNRAAVEAALRAGDRSLARAAEALGVARPTLRAYLRRPGNEALAVLADEMREDLSDMAEARLRAAVRAGEPWAVAYAAGACPSACALAGAGPGAPASCAPASCARPRVTPPRA